MNVALIRVCTPDFTTAVSRRSPSCGWRKVIRARRRNGEIGERGFADQIAVDPDLCPRLRVDAHATVRRLDFQRDDLAGLDRDGLTRTKADRRVDEVQLMHAGRGDDRSIDARAQDALALEHLHFDWRRQPQAAGTLALGCGGERGCSPGIVGSGWRCWNWRSRRCALASHHPDGVRGRQHAEL